MAETGRGLEVLRAALSHTAAVCVPGEVGYAFLRPPRGDKAKQRPDCRVHDR